MTSFHDFLRGVFGLNRHNSDQNQPNRSESGAPSDFTNSLWQNQEDDVTEDQLRRGPMIGFHIFTNPVEIHRYFEKQLDEFMKGFQQSGFGDDFGEIGSTLDTFFGDFNGSIPNGSGKFEVPQLKEKIQPSEDKDLRNFYLKPEFKSPSNGVEDFRDTDLDGKIDPKDVGEILSRPSDSFSSIFDPFSSETHPRISMFGKMVTSKTIRHPDGTVETQKTVKESQGKEEKITTFQKGDQTYSITILKDADGEEKRFENFINIDEDKIEDFKKNFDSNKPMLPRPDENPSSLLGPPAGRSDDLSYWFNKFFKN